MQPEDPKPSLSDFSTFRRASTEPAIPCHDFDLERHADTWNLRKDRDFVEMINPTDNTVSAVVHLGPPPGERPLRLRSDPDDDDDDGELTAKQRAAIHAHRSTHFMRITFAPGERKLIPRSLVEALVSTNDKNEIIGGLAPQLRLAGDPRPPSLHASLAGESAASPFGVPSPKLDQHLTVVEEPRNPRLDADGGADDPSLARRKRAK